MTPMLNVAVMLASVVLAATNPVPDLKTDEIVARMIQMDEGRRATLQSYISTRRYSVDNKRFKKHAEMTVRVNYAFPGTKSYEVISQKGSGIIRKRALQKIIDAEVEASKESNGDRSRIIPENYEFELLGTEVVEGRSCYVLKITPKTENKFLVRGRIWVDAADFAIARMEGSPAKNPSFWTRDVQVEHQYMKHGQVWLPRTNFSRSKIRIFGPTELTIDYFEYQINGVGELPESANASK